MSDIADSHPPFDMGACSWEKELCAVDTACGYSTESNTYSLTISCLTGMLVPETSSRLVHPGTGKTLRVCGFGVSAVIVYPSFIVFLMSRPRHGTG